MSQLKVDSIVPSGGVVSGAAGGGIIQVVSKQVTSSAAYGGTSWQDVTGFSASITPRSTSNKILIQCNFWSGAPSALGAAFKLVRGSTDIALGDSGSGKIQTTTGTNYGGSNDGNNNEQVAIMWLDSPATTSSTTYKLQIICQTATAHRVNSLGSGATGTTYSFWSPMQMILMEVSG